MSTMRDMGYYVYSLLKNNSEKKDALCKKLNFSDNDFNRFLNGRLAITPTQTKTIADFFNKSYDEFINYKNNDCYKDVVHCMSKFSSQEHCNEILDLIDIYIDAKETTENIDNLL